MVLCMLEYKKWTREPGERLGRLYSSTKDDHADSQAKILLTVSEQSTNVFSQGNRVRCTTNNESTTLFHRAAGTDVVCI